MSAAVESEDLHGIALKAQRFGIVTDIAVELSGKVVFPVNFDLTLNIRNALRRGESGQRLEKLIALDPLLSIRLLYLAKRVRRDWMCDVSQACSLLGADAVLHAAREVTNVQLARSRHLGDFSGWAGELWERSLDAAAAAHVCAEKLTSIDPAYAMLAALSKDLSIYYMLYRAAEYPDLRARPTSLKYLVEHWHAGIAAGLLAALHTPREIVEAATDETASVEHPKNLAGVLGLSRALAAELFAWAGGGCVGEAGLGTHRHGLHDAIRAKRAELQAIGRFQTP